MLISLHNKVSCASEERNSMAATEAHKVLVCGGKGALGSACVQYFRDKNWVSCFSP